MHNLNNNIQVLGIALRGNAGLPNNNYSKIYKADLVCYNRMFPSDPKGSLDDFFSLSVSTQTLKNPRLLVKLLIIDGKGRRSVERQSSKSPHFTNNFNNSWRFL